jgi:hypothetical protein
MKTNFDSNTLQNELLQGFAENVRLLSVDARCRLAIRALVL